MTALPKAIADVVAAFNQLPGIGPKSAQRLAYYLLRSRESVSLNLIESLKRLKTDVLLCEICFNFADQQPCSLCQSPDRDQQVICVVEEPFHVPVIERIGGYNGLYHVLHGAISPMEGIGPDDIKLKELVARLHPAQGAAVREVIVATSPTLNGQATAEWTARLLKKEDVAVSQLARGLSSGSDLEFTDDMTFRYALEGRRAL